MGNTFIAGRAMDAVDNTPLPGATVTEVSNPSNTSSADSLGAFSISVSDPSTKLIISFPGYQSLQDTASNLMGDDWLVDNTRAFPWMYQAVRQTGSNLPGTLVTAAFILLFLKIFKLI